MIYSDKQRRISAREIGNLRQALSAAQAREGGEAWLQQAEQDALRSEISKLEADVTEYDMLKAGEIAFGKSFALEGLPKILVQARIAAGISQTGLAEALGLKPQQIQRYEATGYQGASLARLVEVSRVLGVHTEGVFGAEQTGRGGIFSWEAADEIEWRRLPVEEMVERQWFQVAAGQSSLDGAKAYFRRAAGSQLATALHRKKVRGRAAPNEYAILAWQVRVLERARSLIARYRVPEFSLSDRWVPDLVALTRDVSGPSEAVGLLARHGIVLVTERDLPGTYLDGAAMLAESGRAVIGLTLRFDRLDNFWFALFHELGHIFLHLATGLRYDFFDEDGTAAADRIEVEADVFALNSLIPPRDWDLCLSRFAMSEEAVRIDAEKLGIDVSIIAGRIRRERGDYAILNNLIGQGHVRSQFTEEADAIG